MKVIIFSCVGSTQLMTSNTFCKAMKSTAFSQNMNHVFQISVDINENLYKISSLHFIAKNISNEPSTRQFKSFSIALRIKFCKIYFDSVIVTFIRMPCFSTNELFS